jgi:hypothetical protein
MKTHDRATGAICAGLEAMNVQFAFDDPPFIPNCNFTDVTLAAGGIPVPTLSCYAWDFRYSVEYCSRRIDAKQSLLLLNVSVCNKDAVAREGHVWLKVFFQPEQKLFDYHYIPYFWDRSKWPADKFMRVEGDRIMRRGQFGRIIPGKFKFEFAPSIAYQDDAYNRRFNCEAPYFVEERYRLKNAEHLLHFSAELDPDEEKTFTVALLVDEGAAWEYLKYLDALEPASERAACVEGFQKLTANTAKLISGEGQRGDLFNELQILIRQLLADFGDGNGYTPTQGGTSERFYVWVWEAVHMLRPLLQLGQFESVRQALISIFALQDAGCPPRGRFTTTKGAIGTTGPRWANSTGSALHLAAEYCLYSKDRLFQDAYLTKIVMAMEWIVGEVSATRCCDDKGKRLPGWGVMPWCCSTDGDDGYVVSFTDSYTFSGLKAGVELLESLNHPDSARFRRELELYREAIEAAVEQMTEADGYIERYLKIGEQRICRKFRGSGGGIQLLHNGLLQPDSERCNRYVEYFENRIAVGGLTFPMDQDIFYTTFFEHLWQEAYLLRGEWKKAFLAMAVTLKYAVSPGGLQVNERFHRKNPAFTPWQPNGSGSGRILDMLIREIYFERDGTAIVGGGLPWQILRKNKVTALEELFTRRGKVSVRFEMIDDKQSVLKLEGALPPKIRIPDFLRITAVDPGLEACSKNKFSVASGCRKTQLIVEDNSEG